MSEMQDWELVPSELDVRAARCLQRCTLPPGGWTRRFVADVCPRVEAGETISIRQHVWLWRLCYRYRQQIGDSRVLALAGLWNDSTVNTLPDGLPDIICVRGHRETQLPDAHGVCDVRRGLLCWEVFEAESGVVVHTGLASRSEARYLAERLNRRVAAEAKSDLTSRGV